VQVQTEPQGSTMCPPEIVLVCFTVIYPYLGHDAEISKAIFNPQGTKIMTASADKTAIIWSASDSGE